jgi:hypothetical protein
MYLQLINSKSKVKLCRQGYSFLKKKGMDEGWRIHSAGYAVLQFTQFGRIKTYYMHKLLADQFLQKPNTSKKLFVRMKNGNKLDCRIENLEWTTMSNLRRQQTVHNHYRGVSKDGKKYRAVIYDKGERIYLGVFDTPEAAAKAYNEESLKRFGITNSLNDIG